MPSTRSNQAADAMWSGIVDKLNATLPSRAPIGAVRESGDAEGRVDAVVDWSSIASALNAKPASRRQSEPMRAEKNLGPRLASNRRGTRGGDAFGRRRSPLRRAGFHWFLSGACSPPYSSLRGSKCDPFLSIGVRSSCRHLNRRPDSQGRTW